MGGEVEERREVGRVGVERERVAAMTGYTNTFHALLHRHTAQMRHATHPCI